MDKINFENLPSTNTPVNADNLNQVQTNVDNAKLEKTVNVLVSNPNLNDYKTEGRYYIPNGATNIPAGVNGILEVYLTPSGMVKQVWYRHGTANSNDYETYVRTFTSDTWSSWKRYAMVGADDIICRSATATFAETTTTGNSSVTIAASIPNGYKFLCWVGVSSTGWVSEGLYIDNYSSATANVWTGNSVRNPKTVTGYYLCIKNA